MANTTATATATAFTLTLTYRRLHTRGAHVYATHGVAGVPGVCFAPVAVWQGATAPATVTLTTVQTPGSVALGAPHSNKGGKAGKTAFTAPNGKGTLVVCNTLLVGYAPGTVLYGPATAFAAAALATGAAATSAVVAATNAAATAAATGTVGAAATPSATAATATTVGTAIVANAQRKARAKGKGKVA